MKDWTQEWSEFVQQKQFSAETFNTSADQQKIVNCFDGRLIVKVIYQVYMPTFSGCSFSDVRICCFAAILYHCKESSGRKNRTFWSHHFDSYWTDQSPPPSSNWLLPMSLKLMQADMSLESVLWLDKTPPELKESLLLSTTSKLTLTFVDCQKGISGGVFFWLTDITLRCSSCLSFNIIVLIFWLQTTSKILAKCKLITLNTYEWRHSHWHFLLFMVHTALAALWIFMHAHSWYTNAHKYKQTYS